MAESKSLKTATKEAVQEAEPEAKPAQNSEAARWEEMTKRDRKRAQGRA